MPFQRQTAKKIRISDLLSGEWVKKEGMEPSYVVTTSGETVSRARVMATIVARFVSEDGNFGSLTLDDSTDTMRAKAFKELKPIEGVDIGDVVDVIGKVREYNEEIYIIPEIITKIENPNFELLRKLELAAKAAQGPAKVEEKKDGKETLRKEILEIIENEKEGIMFTDLIAKSKADENSIEAVVDVILAEGICYEPTPGRIKKI